MRKYLGSTITAFAAVVTPLFLCGPLLFGVYTMCVGINGASVFLALMGISCTLVWGIYMREINIQLYSWGYFREENVHVVTGLSKFSTIVYEKCKSCGIGFYTHGILNSKVGTKIYFIYLSYDVFDERFRSNINMWKPSQTQIKVQFSKKLYDYLLVVLPKKQSQMLFRDYKKYFG